MRERFSKINGNDSKLQAARLFFCLIFLSLLPVVFFSNCSTGTEPEKITALDTKDVAVNPDSLVLAKNQDENPSKYAVFSHAVKEHRDINCNECHKRQDNSVNPTFAGHSSCIECHFEQFVTENSSMCSICHTDVKNAPAPMRSFPARFNENFNMKFDHAAHMKPGARPEQGCAACHQTFGKGVAMSIPAGINSHANCYTCHTPEAVVNGKNIGSCNTCHNTGNYLRTLTTSKAYNTSFSHSKHQRLSCTDCHTVKANEAQGRQVASPVVEMHHYKGRDLSCAGCHNDRIAFGVAIFTNCRLCHLGPTFTQIPR